jgi:hypothetical protein
MSIVNRRNAILGWSVWQVGKMSAKRKAKQTVQPDSRRPGKRAVISAVAAAGGALWFWRRRNGSNDES